MTDNELVISVLESNETAFEELVKRYRKKVIHTCYGFVHDSYEAEDISQEVFIEVYRSLESFRRESGFSTWLYRICVHKSLNHLRVKKRRKLFVSLENLTHDNSKGGDISHKILAVNPDPVKEEDERIKLLQQGISQLPDKQKTALVLHRYDYLSYKEISEIMELSVSAVESLIYRAKVNLRKFIMKHITHCVSLG